MKESTIAIQKRYEEKYAFMQEVHTPVFDTVSCLTNAYAGKGKLLVCGNGGSCSDADHIVGELLKGFLKKRKLAEERKALFAPYGENGKNLAERLQASLPAINLGAQTSIITAVLNDIGGDEIFAQQVLGYGREGDVFLGITTSGNSKDVINAGITAKALGLCSILLTGKTGGRRQEIFDIVIKVPSDVTCEIQDMHTTVYHAVCAMVENEYWEE